MGDDLTLTEYEIVSQPLTADQLDSLLPALSEFLGQLGAPHTAEYGFSCNLPIEQLWKPTRLTSGLSLFVANAEQQGIAKLGSDDILVRAGKTLLTLCHESDIHLVSSSEETLAAFADLLRRNSIRASRSPYSVQGKRTWSDL